jgi:hypothetical protein
MLGKYAFYCLSLGLGAFVSFITLLILSVFPPTGIIFYFVFKEGAGTGSYFTFFLVLGLPALFTFWLVLSTTEFKISFGSAVLCYISGLCLLLILIPLMATPEITPLMGFCFFVAVALTAGFALFLFLHRQEFLRPEGKTNHYPEWEDYS